MREEEEEEEDVGGEEDDMQFPPHIHDMDGEGRGESQGKFPR